MDTGTPSPCGCRTSARSASPAPRIDSWPGGDAEGIFYAYAYPEPAGYRDRPPGPAAARFDDGLAEFVLPYAAVRTAKDPDAMLLAFFQHTYEAVADLPGWDRAALER